MSEGDAVGYEEYWPLHKRVEELLHTLVMLHRKSTTEHRLEFHAYKSRNEQFDWLEHPGIQRHKNRLPMQMEDVGILRTRKMLELVSNRRDEKTFNLTEVGFKFHDEHCKIEAH